MSATAVTRPSGIRLPEIIANALLLGGTAMFLAVVLRMGLNEVGIIIGDAEKDPSGTFLIICGAALSLGYCMYISEQQNRLWDLEIIEAKIAEDKELLRELREAGPTYECVHQITSLVESLWGKKSNDEE